MKEVTENKNKKTIGWYVKNWRIQQATTEIIHNAQNALSGILWMAGIVAVWFKYDHWRKNDIQGTSYSGDWAQYEGELYVQQCGACALPQ